MTVSTESSKITYDANGATTVWSFPFPGVASDDLTLILTDSDGVETTISPSMYTVTLNAAISPNPTGIGGSITYPTSGSPVALGNTLTITRDLPAVQDTSLANQSTLYQTVIEAALDYQMMVVQGLSDQLTRIVQGPVTDPDGLTYELPAVAARANLAIGCDSDGNITAIAVPSSGTISAAMQPVVNAATLALGRIAFGLGTMAVENIGAGLADDGAGAVRALFDTVADSTNQAVTSAFHFTERHATGALTYTNPASSTLFDGFGYFVYSLTSALTIAIDAGDSFSGMSTGTSLVIPAGQQVYISTNGSGTWFTRGYQGLGLNSPLNLKLTATVAANALTLSVKDQNGNDPSTASPLLMAFRDPTLTNGNPITRAITSGLSLVVPNTALLGTTSAQASRLWLVLFDNGGTPILGVINCSDSTHIYPLDESDIPSGVAISTGSDSAGVFYTASTVTTKAFRILGYIELTQATAGVWLTAPTKIQLFGVGIKRPGEVVQTIYKVNTTTTAPGSGSLTATSLSQAITLSSLANPVLAQANGHMAIGASFTMVAQIYRDTTAVGSVAELANNTAANPTGGAAMLALDIPNTAAPTYAVKIQANSTTQSWNPGAVNTTLLLQELMG